MFNLIEFFKNRSKSSKEVAKNRLKLVLLGDREVSANVLEQIRLEFMDVLYKYLDIDKDSLCIELKSTVSEDGTTLVPALVANIPIRAVRK